MKIFTLFIFLICVGFFLHGNRVEDYTLIFQILVIVFVVVGFSLYHQRKLQLLNTALEKKLKEELSENRKKDTMICQKTKMAAMGEMVGNIAHQWKQPLAILNVTNAILKEKNNMGKLSKEELNSQIEDMEVNILHMSQTVEDFLSYFNPNKVKEDFILLDTIQKAIFMIKQTILKEKIDITISVDKKFKIFGFKEEYIQVIISILMNSIEALKDKEVRNIYFEAFEKDEKIVLEVTDTAGGISEDIINRIFEPYFTTKHKSQGTGLGLYIAKMIIENSINGSLDVVNTTIANKEYASYSGARFIISN